MRHEQVRGGWRGVAVAAALLGLCGATTVARAQAPAGWDPQTLVAPAKAAEAAAKALLDTLRVVVIPAHTPDRQEMLGDIVGDAEQIQRIAHYLSTKAGSGVSYRHLQKAVHRMSRDAQDLKSNASFLAGPERFNQGVAQLVGAVKQLEQQIAQGG